MGRLLAWVCLMSTTLLLGLRDKVEGSTCSSESQVRTEWDSVVNADVLWSQLGGGLPAFTALRTIRFGEFNTGMVVYWLYTAPPLATPPDEPNPSRITLNFRNDSDILFHINTRHDQRRLILNSRLEGSFIRPAPTRDSNFPTVPGLNTTVTILAAEEEFELYATQPGESKYQTNYSYTTSSGVIPITDVTTIDTPRRMDQINPTVYLMAGRVLCNYNVGRVVYIHGRVPLSGDFSILMIPEGPPNIQLFDITLSFRPNVDTRTIKHVTFDSARCTGCSCLDGSSRSGTGSGSGIVYPNSTCEVDCDPWWGTEISDDFPFRNVTNFIVMIVAQQRSFEIAVNGEHYNTYNYRIPIQNTMTVLVSGVPYIERIEYY